MFNSLRVILISHQLAISHIHSKYCSKRAITSSSVNASHCGAGSLTQSPGGSGESKGVKSAATDFL
jgi:hypothetical protein